MSAINASEKETAVISNEEDESEWNEFSEAALYMRRGLKVLQGWVKHLSLGKNELQKKKVRLESWLKLIRNFQLAHFHTRSVSPPYLFISLSVCLSVCLSVYHTASLCQAAKWKKDKGFSTFLFCVRGKKWKRYLYISIF